ncbi:MAG: HAD hydrolase family protein [Clostridia bacterium]|nr:HAD hydrolase family protein [Clostridia bacterium]
MAIGDNANDKEMVKRAGLGVAMGNSMLSANGIGDIVVQDNNQNGVAQAINQYVNMIK